MVNFAKGAYEVGYIDKIASVDSSEGGCPCVILTIDMFIALIQNEENKGYVSIDEKSTQNQ